MRRGPALRSHQPDGSVAQTVTGIDAKSHRWFRFSGRGLPEPNFAVTTDDLNLKVDFLAGTKPLDGEVPRLSPRRVEPTLFNIHYGEVHGWHYHITPGKFPYVIGGYWGEPDPRNFAAEAPGGDAAAAEGVAAACGVAAIALPAAHAATPQAATGYTVRTMLGLRRRPPRPHVPRPRRLAGAHPTPQDEADAGALAAVLNATCDRLEGAFARQARFTADASHELRTPRALARADAGRAGLRAEPVALDRVLADAAASLAPLAARRAVSDDDAIGSPGGSRMCGFDVAVVGGGIVGLATAYRFTRRFPGRRVVVLEKEARVAEHQTGHNSGVLHSGIYYKPGSLKAATCRAGKRAMEAFCAAEGIAHDICGKVIVAVTDAELPALERIHERGVANGITCTLIDKHRLAELEPHAAGVRAIHVPEAGIVNYRQVCERLAERVREAGGEVVFNARVTAVHRHPDSVTAITPAGEFTAKQFVNCAGLHSDRVARLTRQDPGAKIIPFRGEYYALKPDAHRLCRNLIYPTPDPRFPFLGVHFTRMIDGSVECGPNAVLAFGREAYTFFRVNPRDLLDTLAYPGFARMAVRHWRTGLGEVWRSLSKAAFVRALQRLVPDVRAEHLEPAPAGIRAQAVAPDGSLVDDFLIREADRVVNVCNAPSPAATASLQIGDAIVDRLAPRFG